MTLHILCFGNNTITFCVNVILGTLRLTFRLKNVVLIFCKCAIQRAEAGKVWALVTILLLWDGKIANSKEFDNHYDYYYTASFPAAPSVLLRCLLQLFTNF